MINGKDIDKAPIAADIKPTQAPFLRYWIDRTPAQQNTNQETNAIPKIKTASITPLNYNQ